MIDNATNKCCFDGVIIKPDGVHELDPCIYQDIEAYENVTVFISRCINCGHINITWKTQPNTKAVDI